MKTALLAKIARKASQLGLTVNSQSSTAVVIENGSNDLTVSLVDASILSPMGGVSPDSSPFLGIGVVAPKTIKLKSAISTADTIADVLDSAVAAKVLHMLGSFANDILLENSDAAFSLAMRGDVDNIGMGQ